MLVAKGVPGGLLIAMGLTLNQTLAYLAVGLAVGAWLVGFVSERSGKHEDTSR